MSLCALAYDTNSWLRKTSRRALCAEVTGSRLTYLTLSWTVANHRATDKPASVFPSPAGAAITRLGSGWAARTVRIALRTPAEMSTQGEYRSSLNPPNLEVSWVVVPWTHPSAALPSDADTTSQGPLRTRGDASWTSGGAADVEGGGTGFSLLHRV